MIKLNKRKATKKLIKHYTTKFNMPKLEAIKRSKREVKLKIAELNHYKELNDFLELKNINNILFKFENSKGETKEDIFDLKNNKAVKDFNGVVDLVLTNKPKNKTEINYLKLRIAEFHITCAAMSKVFEEDRIEESNYMFVVCITSFLNSLLNERMPTLKLFKEEVEKIS